MCKPNFINMSTKLKVKILNISRGPQICGYTFNVSETLGVSGIYDMPNLSEQVNSLWNVQHFKHLSNVVWLCSSKSITLGTLGPKLIWGAPEKFEAHWSRQDSWDVTWGTVGRSITWGNQICVVTPISGKNPLYIEFNKITLPHPNSTKWLW